MPLGCAQNDFSFSKFTRSRLVPLGSEIRNLLQAHFKDFVKHLFS